MSKTATLDDLLSWDPCWLGEDKEDDLRDLATRHAEWSWDDLVALRGVDGLPGKDWLWVGLRFLMHCERDVLLRVFACDCAQRTLERERKDGREPDERSWAAIGIDRRYSVGEATDEELAAARDAAWAAARADAWAAAAGAAAGAAARAAARAAAGDAETSWQCSRLIELATDDKELS